MLNVFFTVDVEVWCNGWSNLDQQFAASFQKYVYGKTPTGSYGLPYQLELLNAHGLSGVFFVEPLFATRFGLAPLQEMVQLIQAAQQEVQLHLHPEWVDEANPPLLPGITHKRQHLFMYSPEEQTALVAAGLALLEQAGAARPNAFRAGSFGFNRATLGALANNQIRFDSSYNATLFGPQSGVLPNQLATAPFELDGVVEYPMSVFKDGIGRLRHLQLTACSFAEMEKVLWQALETQQSSLVILSHNFELLNGQKNALDEVVHRRFKKLCAFLEKNSDVFCTRGFQQLTPSLATTQPPPLHTSPWLTIPRLIEQTYRRRYG